jgi:integrase
LGESCPGSTRSRAKQPVRLPTVLTVSEVLKVLQAVDDTEIALVVRLLYGTGMRLLEAMRLRIKDVDFLRREIVVREGKGNKDRVTVLPQSLEEPLRQQIRVRLLQHVQDLAIGRGTVYCPTPWRESIRVLRLREVGNTYS